MSKDEPWYTYGEMDDKANAQKLVATYCNMWQEKYGDALNLEFFRDEVAQICLDKMKDDLRENLDFLSVKQLIAILTEVTELLELKKKTKIDTSASGKVRGWNKPKNQLAH